LQTHVSIFGTPSSFVSQTYISIEYDEIFLEGSARPGIISRLKLAEKFDNITFVNIKMSMFILTMSIIRLKCVRDMRAERGWEGCLNKLAKQK